jgi:hypothetical protein
MMSYNIYKKLIIGCPELFFTGITTISNSHLKPSPSVGLYGENSPKGACPALGDGNVPGVN